MFRALIVTIGIVAAPQFSHASCDIPNEDISLLKAAEAKFRNMPTIETADEFFNLLPDQFCKFNQIYGWIDDAPAPLYEPPLFQSLANLAEFKPANELAMKYVGLASEAKWFPDNISALQSAYHELFLRETDIVVENINRLPTDEAEIAVRFLFDGPHPTASFLDPQDKRIACQISAPFCMLLNSSEEQLSAEEDAQ
ncbi:MAG: hypothetical protein AB8B94_07305 [Hyphomicrobiales bacterium]